MAVRTPLRLAAALLFLAVLGGCSNRPPPQTFPEIGWAHLPPIKLNVARIEIVKEYAPSGQAPHVETLAPRTLIDSADRWARDRLQAVGTTGFARFVITDASMVETRLPVQTGMAYAFTNEQNRRYDAHVAVRLEIHNERGYTDGQVTAEASNSHTVAQDAVQWQINETWYLMVQGAMLDLNAALERNINAYLGRFIQP